MKATAKSFKIHEDGKHVILKLEIVAEDELTGLPVKKYKELLASGHVHAKVLLGKEMDYTVVQSPKLGMPVIVSFKKVEE